MQFEFYVLNYDFNKKKVVNYNIFNNIRVQEWTERAVKKYLRAPKKFSYTPFGKDVETIYGFDAFVRELDRTIAWQERGRREYECSVGDAFTIDYNKLEKIDSYYQSKPNMEIIAREVIFQYKKQLREKNE